SSRLSCGRSAGRCRSLARGSRGVRHRGDDRVDLGLRIITAEAEAQGAVDPLIRKAHRPQDVRALAARLRAGGARGEGDPPPKGKDERLRLRTRNGYVEVAGQPGFGRSVQGQALDARAETFVQPGAERTNTIRLPHVERLPRQARRCSEPDDPGNVE